MLKDLLLKLTAVLLLVGMTATGYSQGGSCDMAEAVVAGTYTLSDTIPSNGNNTNPSAGGGANVTGAVWYSFTPTAPGLMSIDACGGGSDTRLWVHSGTCEEPVLVAANDDFCDLGTGDAYASAVANVSVAAGVTYYIEWDDNWSNAAFTWNLNYEALPTVDVAGAGTLPYTRIPDSQIGTGVPMTGLIGNLGAGDLTGAVLTIEVFNANDLGTAIYSAASEAQDLAVGAIENITLDPWTPTMQGDYVITYTASAAEAEEADDAANNSETVVLPVKKTYAFDTDQPGGLGNPDSEIWQGQNFTFVATDTISSVTLEYTGDANAELMNVVIYSTDPETGAPVEELYAQAAPPAAGGWTTVVLDEGFAVEPGEVYFVGLHSISVGNVGLGTDATNFYPGNAWIYLAAIAEAWQNPEAVSANFQLSYAVRPNMKGDAMYALDLAVDMQNEDVGDNGVYVAGTFNGWDAAATEMTDEDADGIYTATVMVSQIGQAEYKFLNGPSFDFEESVPAECGVDNGFGGFNRAVTINTFNTSVDFVCFSACSNCPIVQEPCSNPDAVICDNFDQYTLGGVSGQSDNWTPWPGGDSGEVSDAYAQSASNSLSIVGGGNIDQLLLLPANVDAGNYTANWSFYVPDGKGAYFNLQGDQDNPGGEFRFECAFQPAGTGVMTVNSETINFDFPFDTWFEVTHYLDFDNDWAQLLVDGVLVHQWPISQTANGAATSAVVGAVNFYPLNADYEFYIDDLEIVAVPSCADMSIICDPFESYTVGDLGPQSPWWTIWPGGDEAPVVSGASNGTGDKAMAIVGGEAVDMVLNLGDRAEGNYRFAHDIFVTDGALAYYNIQETEEPGNQWNLDVFMDGDGSGRLSIDQTDVATFTYTDGEWTSFEHLINLDAGTIVVNVNGVEVYNTDYAGTQIGGMNYYPIDATYSFLVDNVNFSELEPTVVEPDPVDVTFTVETKFQEVSSEGMFIAGSFSSWENVAMTDNGDDTWSVTVTVDPNSDLEYKFKNGPDGWEDGVPGDCTVDGNQGSNRGLSTEEADITVETVCFDACVACDLTDVVDVEFDAAIAVSPNPTTGVFSVQYGLDNAADLNIRISNLLGQIIVERQVVDAVSGTERFDLTNMPAGTYNLVVTDGKLMSVKRIVVQ